MKCDINTILVRKMESYVERLKNQGMTLAEMEEELKEMKALIPKAIKEL